LCIGMSFLMWVLCAIKTLAVGFTGIIWACVWHHHKGFTYHTIHSSNFGRMMKSNFLFQMFRNWDPKEIAPLLALINVGRSVISTISAVRFADVLFTPDWTIPPPLCLLLLDPGILVRTHRTAGCRTFSKCTALFQSLLDSRVGGSILGTAVPVL
jgi:hypothetical protein